jgi:FkbM family methyltransferase
METNSMVKIYREVYVFGAGQFAKELSGLLKQEQVKVKALLVSSDNRSFSEEFEIKTISEVIDKETPVLLGVFNHYDNPAVIRSLLYSVGFNTVISPAEIFKESRNVFSKYYLTSVSEDLPTEQEIATIGSFLADDISRKILEGFTRYQKGAGIEYLPQSEDARDQYLGLSLPDTVRDLWKSGMKRIVDVGSFDGDSVRSFIKQKVPDSSMSFICLEPDELNFRSLLNTLRKVNADAVSINAGAGDRPGIVTFEHSGTLSSSELSNTTASSGVISIIKLDQLVLNWRPTLIKMDIEGAETQALLGASEVIRNVRPNLAISVYHRPRDIIDIPLLIRSLNKNYSFFFRCYGEHGYDTVLYCVAEGEN